MARQSHGWSRDGYGECEERDLVHSAEAALDSQWLPPRLQSRLQGRQAAFVGELDTTASTPNKGGSNWVCDSFPSL